MANKLAARIVAETSAELLRQLVAGGSSDQALLSASERLSAASRDAVELERSRRFVDSGSGAQTRLETPSHLDGHGLDRRGSVCGDEAYEPRDCCLAPSLHSGVAAE